MWERSERWRKLFRRCLCVIPSCCCRCADERLLAARMVEHRLGATFRPPTVSSPPHSVLGSHFFRISGSHPLHPLSAETAARGQCIRFPDALDPRPENSSTRRWSFCRQPCSRGQTIRVPPLPPDCKTSLLDPRELASAAPGGQTRLCPIANAQPCMICLLKSPELSGASRSAYA